MVKKIILAYIVILTFFGCTKTVYVPSERKITQVVETRDTVVEVKLPREETTVFVPIDTVAYAETLYAEATARVKTGKLHLSLSNKVSSIKTTSKTVYKTVIDSVPYPVEVPVVVKERYVAWYDKVARTIAASVLCIIIVAASVWIGRR